MIITLAKHVSSQNLHLQNYGHEPQNKTIKLTAALIVILDNLHIIFYQFIIYIENIEGSLIKSSVPDFNQACFLHW